jgi:hypothetical protein
MIRDAVSGGLGTPRPPAEIVNDGRVVTPEGIDVTAAFEAGAGAAAIREAFAPHPPLRGTLSPRSGARDLL